MNTQTLLLIVASAIIALLIAVFHYFYKSKSNKKVRPILTFLRFLSLFSLFLLLINPKIEKEEIELIKPNLVVAVDNSSSIKYLKQNKNVSTLVNDIRKNTALNKKFNVDYFSFSNDVKLLDTLSFEALQTNISKPFKEFKELYKNKTTPVILITDGNQTYGQDYEYLNFKQTVFPVVVGDTSKYADITISQLNVNKYAYLKNKFPVEVFLNYEGEKPISSLFSVFKGSQKVFTKNIEFSKENNSQILSFYLPTNSVGVHYYSAQISPLQNEKNTINNRKNFIVEVIDEQAKVLILTSFLHPDIGTLKTSIETNKQRKVTIKRIGEKLKLEEYQLVVLYQPTNAFNTIFSQLKDQKINSFIITGSKTDWKFLNTVQSNFSKNVINQTENYLANYNASYTSFVFDDIGFESFPPLIGQFGKIDFKIPYESLLFQQIGTFSTENPLLATYENEDVRGAVLFGENSWRWRMTSKIESQDFNDYDYFIGKITQYLSSNKRAKRLSIDYKPIYYANDEIHILANYLDKNYVFDDNASIWLSIKNRSTNEIKRYPFSLQKNNYAVALSGLVEGNYNFTVTVSNQNANTKGSFKVLNFDVEQQFTSANVSKLTTISKKTKGTTYFLNNTTNLVPDLLKDKRFITTQKSEKKVNSIIDWKWLLGLIILSLSVEWFIRKYKGLI